MADPGNIVKVNETQLVVVQRLRPDLRRFHDHRAQPPVDPPAHGGRPAEGAGLGRRATTARPARASSRSWTPPSSRAPAPSSCGRRMPNPGRRFSPGQFVNVRLVLRDEEGRRARAGAGGAGRAGRAVRLRAEGQGRTRSQQAADGDRRPAADQAGAVAGRPDRHRDTA